MTYLDTCRKCRGSLARGTGRCGDGWLPYGSAGGTRKCQNDRQRYPEWTCVLPVIYEPKPTEAKS